MGLFPPAEKLFFVIFSYCYTIIRVILTGTVAAAEGTRRSRGKPGGMRIALFG